MGIFAPIGTVYPNLSAFKLDSFERGLQHGLNLTTRTASPNVDQHTYCQIKVGSEKKYCSFRTVAKNVAGVVQVTQVVEEHTCPAELRKTNEGLAKEIMKDKIGKLRREIEKGGGQVVAPRGPRPSKSEDVTSEPEEEIGSQESEEESDFEDGGSEDETEGRSATSPPKRKKRRTRTTADTSASILQAAVLFPKAQDLFREIALLKQTGFISLPAPNRTFPSARELLVVLHAHSQQRGYTIYRRSSHTQTTKLDMACGRRTSRYKSAPGGRCKYELHAMQNVQGEWTFAGIRGSHNHAVTTLQGNSAATPHAITPSQQITTTSQSSHLPTPNFSPFALSSLPLHSALDHYTPQSISQASLSPAPVVAQLKPLSSYPSDLVSFVRSFESSPSTLDNTLAVLHQVGISSVEVLVLILLTDEGTLEKVKKSVGENVGKKLEEMAAELEKEVASKD